MNSWIYSISFLFLVPCAAAETQMTVRIDFIEALAPRDTTSSERFQKDYEGAIQLGKSLLKPKLTRCGFTLETRTAFYEASDPLKAKELSSRSEAQGAWLIIGPRRSNHYLLLVQGSPGTPTVSLMASADDVAKLGARHTSLSPTNSQMAKVAMREVQARKGKKASYVTVVSNDCINCVDFSKAFDAAADRSGLKKLGEIAVHGEEFDTAPVKKYVTERKPDFVLLPNYSKTSSSVMSAFNDLPGPPLFVGGDGWGDSRYGFVQNGQRVEKVQGFTVRGFPPTDRGLEQFDLGKTAAKQARNLPFSAPGMAILNILDSVANQLCQALPPNRKAFISSFEKNAKNKFRTPWGVSIYDLEAGQIEFRGTQAL